MSAKRNTDSSAGPKKLAWIPENLWKSMKDVVNERHKAGETDFTIGDAIVEAVKYGDQTGQQVVEVDTGDAMVARVETRLTKAQFRHIKEWLKRHPEVESLYVLSRIALLEKTRFGGNGP